LELISNSFLDNFKHLVERFQALETDCAKKLADQGFEKEEISHERILHLRYDRTDCVLMITRSVLECFNSLIQFLRPSSKQDGLEQFLEDFEQNYRKEFGFTISDRPVVIDDIRIRSSGNRTLVHESGSENKVDKKPEAKTTTKCFFKVCVIKFIQFYN
jgi:5-oxoprolinase (ATP-hydrolysing)